MGKLRFTDKNQKDRDFAEEIESYIAHEVDANLARGLSPEEAHRQARLRFGNPRTMREREWRNRSFPWAEDLARDLRFALRALAKAPAFAIIAVAVIAVGIGVNTAVFSVIDNILLKPLPYPDPDQLVANTVVTPFGEFQGANIPFFAFWQKQTNIFQQIAAYDFGGAGLNITGTDHPQQVQARHVTSDYFAMFGARIVAGRTFSRSEDSPNGGNSVVLSDAFWKSRYGASPKTVGSTIQLDGKPYLVIGVVHFGFAGDTPVDLWVPFQFNLNSKDFAMFFTVAARLKPGITLAQAKAQLGLASNQFRKQFGNDALAPNQSFGVMPLSKQVIGNTGPSLYVLWAAVAFVLLIACANVANLLLARAAARKREFATRAALGAGRGQIIRQLLVESLVLSLTGGIIGLALGFTGVRLLLKSTPGNLPRVGEAAAGISLDLNIVLFTLGISLLTGLLFGLVPALSASRANLAAALNENGTHTSFGVRSGRLRSVLVIAEMALTVVLVVGAALLIRTYMNLGNVDPGFAMHNVLTMSMSISGDRIQKSAPVAQLVQDGVDRVRSVPGVLDAGVSNCLPMAGGFGMGFDVAGRPKGDQNASGGAGFCSVSYSYFSSLKIPLLRGRVLTRNDVAGGPGVVVINQAMARRYWPNSDPLKDQIHIGVGAGPAFAEGPRQVVGIVGDTNDHGPGNDPTPMMYIPLAQMPDLETAFNSRVAPLYWFVRSQVDPRTLLTPIETSLRQASDGLPVGHIRTMEELEARNISRQRLNMLLMSVFGFAGLLMAAIGIYGVMSYSVEQRTQELGIRMALGAQASNLRNMVLRQGMILTLIGASIGSGGALWLTHFLASFLFGVKPLDALSFIATPMLLGFIALISVWIPALRATRVDPMTALRIE
jgi:predicted permease